MRREGERASKRLQKSADSAQASAMDAESEEAAFSNQPAEQQPAAPAATILSASAAEAASAGDTEGESAEGGQQAQQQQAQARPQATAAPAAKLTKAQRQRCDTAAGLNKACFAAQALQYMLMFVGCSDATHSVEYVLHSFMCLGFHQCLGFGLGFGYSVPTWLLSTIV